MPSIDSIGSKSTNYVETNPLVRFFDWLRDVISSLFSNVFSSPQSTEAKPLQGRASLGEAPKEGTIVNYQGLTLRINHEGIGELVLDENGEPLPFVRSTNEAPFFTAR